NKEKPMPIEAKDGNRATQEDNKVPSKLDGRPKVVIMTTSISRHQNNPILAGAGRMTKLNTRGLCRNMVMALATIFEGLFIEFSLFLELCHKVLIFLGGPASQGFFWWPNSCKFTNESLVLKPIHFSFDQAAEDTALICMRPAFTAAEPDVYPGRGIHSLKWLGLTTYPSRIVSEVPENCHFLML
ncbi:hypothetical protein KI387_013390, partial [Taxus chinensis]